MNHRLSYFDFGFESKCVDPASARLFLLFAANADENGLRIENGPSAIGDASRYADFYDIEEGLMSLSVGVCAEALGENVEMLAQRASERVGQQGIPVMVASKRFDADAVTPCPRVALYGTIGRDGEDDAAFLANPESRLLGVRAASSELGPALLRRPNVSTCRDIQHGNDWKKALSGLAGPVHLSIDMDVMAPATAGCARSIEPGGLSWYELVDLLRAVIHGPGIVSADLVGVGDIAPQTPGSLLAAQILTKIAALLSSRQNP